MWDKYFKPLKTGEEYRVCKTCGKHFQPNSRTHLYCSKECKMQASRERKEAKNAS